MIAQSQGRVKGFYEKGSDRVVFRLGMRHQNRRAAEDEGGRSKNGRFPALTAVNMHRRPLRSLPVSKTDVQCESSKRPMLCAQGDLIKRWFSKD